jgi:hypothetical protein
MCAIRQRRTRKKCYFESISKARPRVGSFTSLPKVQIATFEDVVEMFKLEREQEEEEDEYES